jgi:DNA processing protein
MTIVKRWLRTPALRPATRCPSRPKSRPSGWAEQPATNSPPGLSTLAAASCLVNTRHYARPVSELSEAAALVALARHGRGSRRLHSAQLHETGRARELLERQHGLLAQRLIEQAAFELEEWRQQGIVARTVWDPGYPENLRRVHDRPPLIFVSGRLEPWNARSVAVIGSRRASPEGLAAASAVAEQLVSHRYTVVSGLAAGIDTAAHTAALAAGGRTIAVIGSGLRHFYPPENRSLQERIAQDGAVVAQFLPDTPARRQNFPLRNALMSGISLANVVVEASPTSGARTQARLALAHGRGVILLDSLLRQGWARELAERPGTHVVRTPAEVPAVVERLAEEALAA